MSPVNLTPPAALAVLSGTAGTLPVRTNRGSSAATEDTAKTGCAETPRLLFGQRQNVEKHRSHYVWFVQVKLIYFSGFTSLHYM